MYETKRLIKFVREEEVGLYEKGAFPARSNGVMRKGNDRSHFFEAEGDGHL